MLFFLSTLIHKSFNVLIFCIRNEQKESETAFVIAGKPKAFTDFGTRWTHKAHRIMDTLSILEKI